MSFYLSVDPDKEIKQRIGKIDELRENLIDMEAEYQEIVKRNPLIRGKGSGDGNGYNSGTSNTNPIIVSTMRIDSLEQKITEHRAIINDYERGWSYLSKKERDIMSMRYKEMKKQRDVAKKLCYSEKQIQRIEEEAFRKLRLHMVIY